MLAQLSGSLQQLASKVCPAVVQIEVAGFGPAAEGDPKQTALIVRQHGIGAGVIVEPMPTWWQGATRWASGFRHRSFDNEKSPRRPKRINNGQCERKTT